MGVTSHKVVKLCYWSLILMNKFLTLLKNVTQLFPSYCSLSP